VRILLVTLLSAGAVAAPTVVSKIGLAAGTQPCAAAGGGGFVWVSEYASPYLLKIDPHTNKVVGKTKIGFGSCGLGFGAGSLWVEDTNSNTVSRVSARSGKRTAAIAVGAQPYDATFAYGAAWVTSYGYGDLERIEPGRNRVVRKIKLPGATGVVAAFGSVWATGKDGVVRVDPATNRIAARIAIEQGAGWTAASPDAVWVTSANSLIRIDPSTNDVAATIPLDTPFLGDPAVVGGTVWVPKVRANALAIVDPATNAVTSTVKTGAGPFVVSEIGGDAWIPSWHGRDVWRLRP
jgi:YVTN family beta-propeller protein